MREFNAGRPRPFGLLNHAAFDSQQPKLTPEQMKPLTIELPNWVTQKAVYHALFYRLELNTNSEINPKYPFRERLLEENKFLRGIVRSLMKNLNEDPDEASLLHAGLVEGFTNDKLREIAEFPNRTNSEQHELLKRKAAYFLDQRAQQQ